MVRKRLRIDSLWIALAVALLIMGAVLFMVGMQKQADFVKKQPPTFIYTGEKKMVLRVRTQGVMLLVYFAYICVHFLYACVGSSLIWMHF